MVDTVAPPEHPDPACLWVYMIAISHSFELFSGCQVVQLCFFCRWFFIPANESLSNDCLLGLIGY